MKKVCLILFVSLFYSSLGAQIINFPDANLKAKLLSAATTNMVARDFAGNSMVIDTNNNGEIEVGEADAISRLWIQGAHIVSAVGITSFHNLVELGIFSNDIVNLDLSGMTSLIKVECYHNKLQTLNVTGLVNLEYLDCSGSVIAPHSLGNNHITSLDVSTLTNLNNLSCEANNITTLDLSGLAHLEILDCSMNYLTALNINGDVAMTTLNCYSNQLSFLDASNLPLLIIIVCDQNQLSGFNFSGSNTLYALYCASNLLTTLDLSNTNVQRLDCSGNPLLTSLNIKNGKDLLATNGIRNTQFSSALRYVCCDESEMVLVQQLLNNIPLCTANTYCSFTPGGTFYTINGNTRFDSNNNGCSASDPVCRNLKFDVNGSGLMIASNAGSYSCPFPAGDYTLTPLLEHPGYFTASPSSVTVSFPTQSSPVLQDFCIAPNGIRPDLEIMAFTTSDLRPGFEATYKIIYRNKGNQQLSGTVNFSFNDTVLDLVSANPLVSSLTENNLSWTFADLLPFETREITMVLSLNSPTDNPPVVGGSILYFTAQITGSLIDQTPSDNVFNFNETVVNSFDPNDKTCLEGATITTAMVGKYVHYLIRFENTGTANAQNIVVADMIDAEKFDIASLVPIAGSHPFVTRFPSMSKVEFIFENINLPFDDANNDGYVMFKIKTNPWLWTGSTFSNTASIYFDYNFPIVTNTTTTTVALLANPDFAFGDYFKIYPNPVKAILNIETKKTIEITSINIYNTLGQLVMTIPNAQQTQSVDVSDLKTGNYFLKINSSKGTSSVKFVKM